MPHPSTMPDPASCPHARVQRIGIQKAYPIPVRLYLVTCTRCGTTLTTRTLRERGGGKGVRLAG